MRTVRRLLLLTCLAVAAGAGYAAVPFYTAWNIREAVKSNDSAYLESKIVWPRVRATLKESLTTYATSVSGQLMEPPANPSWWQQLKTYLGKGAIDRFVDTAVTPTGLHGVMTMRRNYQAAFEKGDDERTASVLERVKRIWARVTRAEFTRYDRLELEMVDRLEPDRTIVCALELQGAAWGLDWRLAELRVKPTNREVAARVAAAVRSAGG